MIDNNNGNQVKWNELLIEFSGQNVERMITAMSMLSPSQIDSIIDAGNRAKERSKTRHFEALKAKLLNEGVDVTEFMDYLTAPKAKTTATKSGPRLTKEERRKMDNKLQFWIEEGCDSPKELHDRLMNDGIEVAYNTVAAKSLSIRKKLQKAA